jgi:hypothetical protein
MAPTLKDMATWTDVIGHAQLRSFVDDEGNFWLEQKRLQADQGGKTGAQRAQRRMGVRRSRGSYTGRMLIDGEIYTPSEATKKFLKSGA